MADCGNLARLASVNETFDGELKTRLNDPVTGTIVIVHQRLNRCDLTGHVLKQRGLCFKHRCLALVATHDHKYRLKHGIWLRKEGDILRAGAYTPEYIADLRENTGAPGFGPIYQQTFDGPDVLQVRREDFVIEPFYAPPAASYLLSVDLNHKGVDGQSYSVIQCWAILADRGYLLYDQW